MFHYFLKSLTVIALLLPFPLWAKSAYEIPGKSLKFMLGQPIAQIRVYAAGGQGVLKPIPFQVDEREGGNFLLQDPVIGATLDAQDVVVVMEEDGGAKFQGSLPPNKAHAEVQLDGAGKFIYILLEETPGPLSPKSYVQYDPVLDRVQTDSYQIGFKSGSPIVMDLLVIRPQSGGKDILDRFKVRLRLALKHFFDFYFNEEEIQSKRTAFKVGPVRAIRRLTATKKVGPVKVIPKSTVDFVFYSDWILIPSKIINPMDGKQALDDNTEGLSGLDFNRNIYGSFFRSNLNTQAIILDGNDSAGKKGLKGPLKWWSLSGLQGSMVVGVKNDPQLSALGLAPQLKLVDTSIESLPPESENGQVLIGTQLPYHLFPKGNYELQVMMVFPERFVPGSEEEILRSTQMGPPVSVSE